MARVMPSGAQARRLVYLVHRWTGVAGCLLMASWLVSGVVMLFVGYPKLLPHERLQDLPALAVPGCCVPVEVALSQVATPASVQQVLLTSIGGRPRYRLKDATGGLHLVDALTGRRVPRPDGPAALASARAFMNGAPAILERQVQDDRWTHSGALDAHRPLYQVQVQDAQATRLYVSSATGEVVMKATRAERRWNAVGAWLHWLYMFRDGSRDAVWSWLVIGLSAVCTLSCVAGAMAGLWRWRFSSRYKSGARTPYREFHMRWHHVSGLVFGTVLVAWIFSGLMSMNPFGLFDPRHGRPDAAAYRGGVPGTVRPALGVADALRLLERAGLRAREIEWRVLAGEPHLLARDASGATRLVIEEAGPGFAVRERWSEARLASAAEKLLDAKILSARPLHAHDTFYYARQAASMYGAAERRLPVLRLGFDDPGRTLVYLDPFTGDVALSVDQAQRAGRWLFNLLHSWDLPPFLRHAGLREAMLIVLSAGSMAVAWTGVVIGWRRLNTFRCQRWHRGGARPQERRSPRKDA